MKAFFTRWYQATRPVPEPGFVPDPAKLALKSRQRRFLKRCAGIALLGAAGVYAFTYVSDAPNRARVEMARGVSKMSPGAYDQAIAHFDRAIGIWPDLAEAYLYRAVAEHGVKRVAEALADLRDFNDTVLQTGAVPLHIVERTVDAWIAAQKAKPARAQR